MDKAYFFSDETGSHSGGRYFVVVGVAFTQHRLWIRDDLEQVERACGKGKQDWKGTKNLSHRIDYIERVLEIQHLQGTVFYAEYLNNKKEYWSYTVDALTLAIQRFGVGRISLIRHQGFNAKTRQKFKASLRSCGCEFEIQSGSDKRAEVRLADALCGYVGLVKHNADNESANYYPNMPDWFIDLKTKPPTQG